MAQIICIIGNTSGAGKTTLTHMLAHGLGLFGKDTVAVLTDPHRQGLKKANRNYLPFDARRPENLRQVVVKLRELAHWHGVIDYGGNRPSASATLAALADLVLLPFRDSQEGFRSVAEDLQRFPRAYALPSQWPTDPWQLELANQALERTLPHARSRVLEPVYAQSATTVLLEQELPSLLPAALNNSCRMLALQAMELVGIPLPEEHWLSIATASGPQSAVRPGSDRRAA
jgi:chromosome partitioning protein